MTDAIDGNVHVTTNILNASLTLNMLKLLEKELVFLALNQVFLALRF